MAKANKLTEEIIISSFPRENPLEKNIIFEFSNSDNTFLCRLVRYECKNSSVSGIEVKKDNKWIISTTCKREMELVMCENYFQRLKKQKIITQSDFVRFLIQYQACAFANIVL